MKTIRTLTLTLLATLLLGTGSLWADDGHWDAHRYDRHGYWDHHHHFHTYAYWHNHPGYWDCSGPVRVFISCG